MDGTVDEIVINSDNVDDVVLTELKRGYTNAQNLLSDKERTEEFLQILEKKLKTIPAVGETLAMVPILISLVRSYVRKEYTGVPVGTIIAIVSALIYVFSPADLISDTIPVAGYADDAFVIDACLKLVKSDVDDYQLWREQNNKILIKDLENR